MRTEAAAHIPAVIATVVIGLCLFQTSNADALHSKLSVPASGAQSKAMKAYRTIPLTFEPNQGQSESEVRFLARGAGYTLYLETGQATFALDRVAPGRTNEWMPDKLRPEHAQSTSAQASDKRVALVHMKFLGVNNARGMRGLDELPGKSTYFNGNDPSKWHTNIPNYAKIEVRNIYSGIDLSYYGNHQQLEYDFAVAPGVQPSKIQFLIAGLSAPTLPGEDSKHGQPQVGLDTAGDLVLQVDGAEVTLHKPVVYQESLGADSKKKIRHYVEGDYVVTAGNRVSFHIGRYNRAERLIIDPVITYSSMIGGSGLYGEMGSGIAVDGAGNAYVTGIIDSPDFPIVNEIPGACAGTCGDQLFQVGFITKVNAAGTALVYSSFFGGSSGANPDYGQSVAVDTSGNVYITGVANSADFPVLNQIPGSCNQCLTQGAAFVMKINGDGSALLYSTLLGGSSLNYGNSIALDGNGNVHLAGSSASDDFPVINPIPGACQGTCGSGGYNPFVAEINAAGTAFVYSSWLGGSGDGGTGNAVAVDAAGDVYVAGYTSSPDFPVVNPVPGACQGTCGNSDGDAFLTKINPAGSALIYSTLIGGSFGDGAYGVAIDGSGNVYITGNTYSPDFPQLNPIPGSCQGTCGTGLNDDSYVTKISGDGTALLYSTLLGSSGDDFGAAVAVDSAGDAYATGYTVSSDFPVVNPIAGACQTGCANGSSTNIYLTEISADGSSLAYSTYIGGDGGYFGDWGTGIHADDAGNAYLVGFSNSNNFPVVNQIPGACNGTCGHSGFGGPTAVVLMKISSGNGAGGFRVIHNFTGGRDGGAPAAGPTLDAAGNLYGTSYSGGAGDGTVYKLARNGSSWVLNLLYSFSSGEGSHPEYGGIVIGPAEVMYATTSSGGTGNGGTVLNLRPRPTACAATACPWHAAMVHEFMGGSDGLTAMSSVVFDAAANLYGTTYHGGDWGEGTIYEATHSNGGWAEAVLYSFEGGSDGANPVSGLTIDSAGNLYGTTSNGGANGRGTIFELMRSGSGWTKTILYNFTNGDDGRTPFGGVVFDQVGNLYGTTTLGGSGGGGVVYELSPSNGSWSFRTLYSFAGSAGPYSNVTLANGGDIYGTTFGDGVNRAGSVFELSLSNGAWRYTSLHDFTGGSDGGHPSGAVALDQGGNLYGTASQGGSGNQGVAFEITQ